MKPLARRDFMLTAAALPLTPWLGGCGRPPAIPLAIAAHVWPGYEPMFLARREGWLDPAQVRLVETGSATESLQALAGGKVDGAALTLDEVLRGRVEGSPLTIVMVFDVSAGADLLLARPAIKTLSDLKGRRIGVEQGAVGALMYAKSLEAGGLNPTEVNLVPLTIAEQVDAWQKGHVDAVVTYEPVSSQLLALGARRLFDSRQLPDLIVDVLAVRRSILDSHPDAIRNLLAGHLRALDHLRRSPQDAAYRMAPRMKLAPDQVLASFKGLVLADLANNRRLLGGAPPPLISSARKLSTLMVKEQLLPREDALDGLLSAQYLPRAESR